MLRLLGKSYVENLINMQMNDFALENRSFKMLRDLKVKEIILDNVIEIVIDDYIDEDINRHDLFCIVNKIYNELLKSIKD